METIRRMNPIVAIVLGIIVGLLLGALIFYGLWPVQVTDIQPFHLSREGKAQYMTLVSDSYQLERDRARVEEYLDRWYLEEIQLAIADAIEMYEAEARADKVQALQDLRLVLGISEAPPTPPEPSMGLWERIRPMCLVFVVVLLVAVLGYIGYRVAVNRRQSAAGPAQAVPRAAAVPRAEEWEGVGQPPLGHFFTTYKLGEDTYDESFSIETPMGDFLGECGVGISETISTGAEHDKVTAFEVWLFDKSDIRTVTKVLMSDHAFTDEAMKAKLASKGEAVLAQTHVPFSLETSGLEVRVSVTEMEYGEGDAPADSFFNKLTVELVAMAKPAESGANSF